MTRAILVTLVLFSASCGPDAPIDTIQVTTTNDDGVRMFEWDGGPVGALAVYECEQDCPLGEYRDPTADAPRWHVTGEDYDECTYARMPPPVTYGAVPTLDFGNTPFEGAPAQPLAAGADHVVVWRYAGCLPGGPLDAGRARFTAP